MNRLQEKYLNEIREKLLREFNFKNVMASPKLEKVVISIGAGEAKDDQGILEKISLYLTSLTGQKPVVTLAKKSIANFKLSKGQPVGMMVTLRGVRMFAFLDKLFNVVLPKVRDFRGVSEESFDGTGNFNLGLREQLIFPEVDYKLIDKVRGLAVTIVTTAKNEQGKRLLELLGLPFQKGNYGQKK